MAKYCFVAILLIATFVNGAPFNDPIKDGVNIVVKRAKEYAVTKRWFNQGCSGLVSNAWGVAWEYANDFMGANPIRLGIQGQYNLGILKPGDVVGYKKPAGQSGHVAIFIGEPTCLFIHQNGYSNPENRSECKMGFGGTNILYKSSRTWKVGVKPTVG
jgi:hypothetical protein